jgi:hypothetical protein
MDQYNLIICLLFKEYITPHEGKYLLMKVRETGELNTGG